MRTKTDLIVIFVFSVLVIAFGALAAEPNLKEIMQGLRDDSVAIADGLLTDDLSKVAQGADRIATHAQIPPEQVQLVAAELGVEMAVFKQFDTTVHDLSLSIATAARNNDRDQAIADYQRMLNGCLACHAGYKERVATVLSQSDMSVSVGDPQDYVLWSSDVVDAAADRLEKSLGDKALVWETVGNYQGHSVYLVLRGKTSRAEIHDTESDVQISINGKATSVVGGVLVDAESLPRKQQRGTSIEGGTRQELTPGDIMHIPPGAPHQLLIGPEDDYMYLLIKIDEEPLQ